MTVPVECHGVPLGHDLAGERGEALDLLADQEERGGGPPRRERLEDGRGPLGVGAVVASYST